MRDKWAKKRMRRRQRKKRKMKKWAQANTQGLNSTCTFSVLGLWVGLASLQTGQRLRGARGLVKHSEHSCLPRISANNLNSTGIFIPPFLQPSIFLPLSIFLICALWHTAVSHWWRLVGPAEGAERDWTQWRATFFKCTATTSVVIK